MDAVSFGLGIKSQKTRNSSLIKLVEGKKSFNKNIKVIENNTGMPLFNSTGFVKPDNIILIKNGKHCESLVSPRSAKEYGVTQNGADSLETPESLELDSGEISPESILKTLDNGIYINNLHYLNYSDMSNCSVTGMSRFACFEVKNGRVTTPINVMRFDVSMYDILGKNLVGSTSQRERIFSTNTYRYRHMENTFVPGIVADNFKFTL